MIEDQLARHIWGGTTETLMHPATMAVLVLAVVMIFILDREKAFTVFALAALMLPMTQRGVFMGLNFMSLRILIIAVWARLFFRMELRPIRLNAIDTVFLLWVVSNITAFVLLWQTWGAFVNRMGFLLDSAGIYFLCRYMFTNMNEMNAAARSFAVFGILLAGIMLLEQITGRNPFYLLGGVGEMTEFREGRLRSKGPFAHPILAGTFGAVLFPMLFSQWRRPELRTSFLVAGMVASVLVVILSASSGPVLALVLGIVALNMWPFREHLPKIKWALIVTLVGLHLAMKAPVWALIDKVGVVAGSSSYHRFFLVDQFIKRFDEWWLLGTKSTHHWGWMMWDAVNQFVAEGIRGGLATLVLFLLLIMLCYRAIGRKIAETGGNGQAQLTLWAIGSALFAHTVSFFGIAYFDQIIVIWYFLLAVISTISGLPAAEISPAQAKVMTKPKPQAQVAPRASGAGP